MLHFFNLGKFCKSFFKLSMTSVTSYLLDFIKYIVKNAYLNIFKKMRNSDVKKSDKLYNCGFK